MSKCQHLGEDFDPMKWDYMSGKSPCCGAPVVLGRSYCADHVWKVYKQGTSRGNGRKLKELEREVKYIIKNEGEYSRE
jgi:hypothetical protein